ncbi:hypothetical protein G7051_04430 [Dysgonomonas sp. HDW5B]|uniref:hypothetical protein n=1 Tax=Dysgonomonas sp. HDW5B TaxID=2714927 RepID=UPI00140D7665|nr:hypothetical protein [Dysgonomonas sp. HDW5B]QIK53631.1 hypothetical protein G7051_04425 [Dysgonomonas sp. HDW5B]QIK53632.1 hypothetical protein G7051_04430 [Dysgonomonas sp. HDW5B]
MSKETIKDQELINVELDAETLNDLEQTELKGGATARGNNNSGICIGAAER